MISPTYQSAINVWSKNLPELGGIKNPATIEDIPWAGDKEIIDKIDDFIMETYENNSTIKKHLCALLYIIGDHLPDKSHWLRERIGNLLEQQQQLEKNNVQDDHEKMYYKSYDELLKIRHKLAHNRNKTYEAHMVHLLLCMYVDTPPIRTEYMNLDIVNSKPSGDVNALHITKGGRCWLYINNDKVSRPERPALYYRLPSSLAKKINESLKKYPRNKLILPRITATETTQADFYYLMNKISDHMGVSLLRSAYITHFYKSNPSINAKDDLAHKMRHSRETAEIHYNKTIPHP